LIVGPYVQIVSNTPLNYPIRAGHAWERDCAGPDICIEDGQLGLPITPEML
jgi:hypothetical protein